MFDIEEIKEKLSEFGEMLVDISFDIDGAKFNDAGVKIYQAAKLSGQLAVLTHYTSLDITLVNKYLNYRNLLDKIAKSVNQLLTNKGD